MMLLNKNLLLRLFPKFLQRLHIILLIMLMALNSGCTKDDVIKPAKLTQIKSSVKIQTLWSEDVGKPFEKGYWTLRPAVVTDRVFVTDAMGQVSAYTLDRGRLVWRKKLNAQVTAGVFADTQQVYVALISGDLVALNADTGAELWRQNLNSEMLAPVARLSGYVVAQTIDGHVQALDSQTGAVIWRYDTVLPSLTLWGTSAPVITNGTVLAGFANGKLVSLDLTTGRLVWERWIGIPKGRSEFERLTDLDGQFWVQDDVVYAVGYQSRIAALSLPQGQPVWTHDLSSYVALTADASSIYVADAEGTVWSLDLQTGSVQWQQPALNLRQLSGLAVQQNQLLVGDLEGYLHVLNADTGEFIGRSRLSSSPLRTAAILADDRIVIQASDARLKVLTLKNSK